MTEPKGKLMEGRLFYRCSFRCEEGLVTVPGMPCLACRLKTTKTVRNQTMGSVLSWVLTVTAFLAVGVLWAIAYKPSWFPR